jgi:hypothetical protein
VKASAAREGEMSFPERVGPTQISTSLATLRTIAQPERLLGIVLTNTTAGALTVTVYIVPSGQAAGAGNQLFGTLNVPANDVVVQAFNIPLRSGDSIQAIASGTGVNFWGTVTNEKNP